MGNSEDILEEISEEASLPNAFFLMPEESLFILRKELELSVGIEQAALIMSKYGYNCGRYMARHFSFQ